MTELELLIDDYERRMTTIKDEIKINYGKMKCGRLETKASCYRTFISELKRINKHEYGL
jgi:hypothetical protein